MTYLMVSLSLLVIADDWIYGTPRTKSDVKFWIKRHLAEAAWFQKEEANPFKRQQNLWHLLLPTSTIGKNETKDWSGMSEGQFI